jgi:hypothetical protein
MPSIEFLILANHAEAQNNLLYISGGGWSDLFRPPPGPEGQLFLSHFGIATSIQIPWDETNQQHHLVIGIERDDGTELGRVESDILIGRPPQLDEGSLQTTALGIGADVAFPETGAHKIVATLGDDTRSVSFRVHDQASQTFQQG